MSKRRRMGSELRNRYRGKKGPNGRNLCSWCGTEVTPPRRTFCSEPCIHEWRLRTDPQYVRSMVLDRDNGICSGCGLDCAKLERVIGRVIRIDSGGWECAKQTLIGLGFGKPQPGKSLWQADHIIEVVNGGGECGLDNYQTLCSVCHQAKTNKLASDRAKARRRT